MARTFERLSVSVVEALDLKPGDRQRPPAVTMRAVPNAFFDTNVVVDLPTNGSQ